MPSLPFLIIAAIGALVSGYGLHVERRKRKERSYRPWCDFREGMMCSTVLTSEYSHLLGPSNALLGLLFYPAVAVLHILGLHDLVLIALVASVMGSVVLAYLLTFRLRDFCIVCTTIYAVNIAMLVIAL